MKKIIHIIIIAAAVIMTSCSAYTKVTVYGSPGTVIKNAANNQALGTIGVSSSLEIQLARDQFYAYLLSKAPDSDIYVPFALEYKNNTSRYYAVYGAAVTGAGVAIVGSATMLGGAIAAVVGGPPAILLAGLGASAGGVGLALPVMLGPGDDVENCYQYLPSTTNNDLIH